MYYLSFLDLENRPNPTADSKWQIIQLFTLRLVKIDRA